MNSLALKGAIGAGTATTVAGITTLAVGSSKGTPQPISKLLSDHKPDRRLLFSGYQGKENGTHDAWKFVWKKYRNDYLNSRNNPFKLPVVNGTADEAAPENFMNACKGLFEEKVANTESDKYLLVLEYCTRPTLVSDWIWGMGHEMASQSGDAEVWKGLWKSYHEKAKDEWGLNKSYSEGGEAPQEFKSKCATESEKHSGNPKDTSVLSVFNYCSKVRTN
ncbi:hypothetical protein HF1_02970 [Mycoplasma haemofelis str. Langford 1]|uniref:Uncharacterized protein n=1 Tax=Mycoplasma haemofelis (strain Langford 1) TaxID=941640 RepID=E8ZGN4_MYCHL|nr:hypothetical protein [Mycoplasma haemofelis]CBY92305.1 hypothetical protein HF1_02970 [Mycoplasma haemofelis str. Langford 1]